MKTKSQLYSKVLPYFLSILMVIMSACGSAAGLFTHLATGSFLNADYGDAPDALPSKYPSGITAYFPSRASSDGARHDDTTKVALGMINDQGDWPNTPEADATDPADSDGIQNIDEQPGDSDNDARDNGLLTLVFGDDEEATLQFAVTAASDSPQNTYYLNVLFDWNKDGFWAGSDVNGAKEWAVKNYPVNINPGETIVDRTGIFDTGLNAHPVWVRLTLSEVPVDESLFPDGWDGTGAFALGETEDYYLDNNQIWDFEDEDGKIIIPGGLFKPIPFPPPGGGGGGGGGGNPCEFNYSMRLTLCKGRSAHRLLTIGGFAPDSITASSDNSSVASVNLNEANVTINGKSEGTTTIRITATQGRCTYYLTLSVEVKDCPPKKKVRIDCCSPEQIRRDPSQCKNCHIVGRQFNQTNTHGGGGMVPETAVEGRKTNISKSFVLLRGGGLADVITVYYECDPCPENDNVTWLDDIIEEFFAMLDQELFGGDNGIIDTWEEYEALTDFYDADFDEADYECAERYFNEILEGLLEGEVR